MIQSNLGPTPADWLSAMISEYREMRAQIPSEDEDAEYTMMREVKLILDRIRQEEEGER